MTNFMAEGPGGGGESATTARARFAGPTTGSRPPSRRVMSRIGRGMKSRVCSRRSSRRFFVNGELIEKADSISTRPIPNATHRNACRSAERSTSGDSARRADALGERPVSDCKSIRGELEPLDYNGARERVLHAYDTRYRPELYQTERALILEMLDTAWKDHLYYMDHLRSGIGLVGYAQFDPKVEYKREGRNTFLRCGTASPSRSRRPSSASRRKVPGFVGSLWEITAVSHAEAAPRPTNLPPKAPMASPRPNDRRRTDPQPPAEGRP